MRPARQHLALGAALLGVGIVVTLLSTSGVVAYGAILVGAIEATRGLRGLLRKAPEAGGDG